MIDRNVSSSVTDPTGSEDSCLVVLRGPSGAGKSSTARRLRAHLGRSVALVEQDYLRRTVLKEKDVPDGHNIALIDQTVRFALDRGWHVICEGIMHAEHYRGMLERLRNDHVGRTEFYYFDVSWSETLRRHETRPQVAEFGPDEMWEWYRPSDRLGVAEESIIGQENTVDQTVRQILQETFGQAGAPVTR